MGNSIRYAMVFLGTLIAHPLFPGIIVGSGLLRGDSNIISILIKVRI